MASFATVVMNLDLRSSSKWRRAGWNGKGMFIFLMKNPPPVMIPGIPEAVEHQRYVAMYTVQGTVVPWLVSQSDLLSDDWEEVSNEDLNRIIQSAPRFK